MAGAPAMTAADDEVFGRRQRSYASYFTALPVFFSSLHDTLAGKARMIPLPGESSLGLIGSL